MQLPRRPLSPTSLKHREVRHGDIWKKTYRRRYNSSYWEYWDKRAVEIYDEIKADSSVACDDTSELV